MSRDARELAGVWTKYQRHTFRRPSPDLAAYIEHYWIVTWDYRTPYRQLIVPYPNVHLTFRDGAALVNGVRSGHHVKVLDGQSGVFGVQFRPGCFRPFLRAPVSTLTNRSVDARQVFEGDLPDPPDVESINSFLKAQRPEPDAKAAQAAHIVAEIAANPQITRVDALAHDLGTSVRALQRLFSDYVGIGPKWVIRRYRLHEVTERLAHNTSIEWAELAVDLGYADQAHFTRDFKGIFGEPPTMYAERYQR